MARRVALLHGWGGSFAATFAAHGWVPGLQAAGYEVVALDLPGHGDARPVSDDPARYSDLAGGVDALLPPGALDLVGYSLGAKLALELASRSPKRFGRIVAGGIGDNLFMPEPNAGDVATALLSGNAPAASRAVQAVLDYAGSSGGDPGALAAVLRRPANPIASRDRLGRVSATILLVNGTADQVARPDSVLLSGLPNARHVLLEGVGHFELPAADAFREAALAFLGPAGP